MFIIEVVHIQCSKLFKTLEYAVLFMVGYCDSRLPSVAILPRCKLFVGHMYDFGFFEGSLQDYYHGNSTEGFLLKNLYCLDCISRKLCKLLPLNAESDVKQYLVVTQSTEPRVIPNNMI